MSLIEDLKKKKAMIGKKTAVDVPSICPCCGAKWKGDSGLPGDKMKFGARVFYDCGCSISVCEVNTTGYMLLIKHGPEIEIIREFKGTC